MSPEVIPNRQSKIKILHLITDLDSGGAQMMLFKLLSAMDRNLFTNQVVSMTDIGGIGEKIEKLDLPVKSLGMRKGFPSWKAYNRFSKIIREEQPNIIQTWMYHADLLGALAVKKRKSPRLVWNIRCSNMDFSRYRFLTKWVVKCCVWCSSFPVEVIVNSKQGYQYHLKLGYHPPKWEVIPNGFNLQHFTINPQARIEVRKELQLKNDSLLIGMVGRFDAMKDHQTFLSAAATLAQQNE
jgi:glycosyltransferase involved in cell wall biosynthesis